MQFGTIVPAKPRRAVARTFVGLAAAVVASPFVATAWGSALGAPLPWPLHVVLTRLPALFPIHMAAAGSALLLVPLALASVGTPRLHRVVGWLAALAMGLGGVTALVVAPMSMATPLARAGFLVQGIVWLALAGAGLVAIRRKRRELHAKLMTATVIVTVAPVLLRIVLLVAVRHQWAFTPTYAALAWGSWLLPLALYAMHLMRGNGATREAPQLVGALQTALPTYEKVISIGNVRP